MGCAYLCFICGVRSNGCKCDCIKRQIKSDRFNYIQILTEDTVKYSICSVSLVTDVLPKVIKRIHILRQSACIGMNLK